MIYFNYSFTKMNDIIYTGVFIVLVLTILVSMLSVFQSSKKHFDLTIQEVKKEPQNIYGSGLTYETKNNFETNITLNHHNILDIREVELITGEMNLNHMEDISVDLVNVNHDCISIEDSLFFGYPNLTVVTLNKLKTLPDNTFGECYSLKQVFLDSLTEDIGFKCFNRCYKLQSINFKSMKGDIKESAFKECYSLESVKLGSMEGNIEKEAFKDCKRLKVIELPKMKGEIMNSCFQGCVSLEEVNLKVVSLGNEVFKDCLKLKTCILDEITNKSLGERTFNNCKSLLTISLKNFNATIGEECFMNCKSLQSFSVNGDKTIIGNNCFKNCSNLFHVNMENTQAETIGNNAFENCLNLENVNLSNIKATSLNNTFKNCISLKSLLFGSKQTITSISLTDAFESCVKLGEDNRLVKFSENITFTGDVGTNVAVSKQRSPAYISDKGKLIIN